ncbi:MAG: archaellin/type IV pilin N-terminal domain-containing protein [Thermoplasmatota archaeon]
MKRIKRDGEKGAMGVGTLIIFIAMVLVAAVAASVLIDTANKLQQQAQKTGDQAIREVSTSFIVKEVVGIDSDDDSNIEYIHLKIGLAAGSPEQNLKQTLIEIDNGSVEQGLNFTEAGFNGSKWDGSNAMYGAKGLLDPENDFSSDSPIVSQGTTVKINISATNLNDGEEMGIGPQEEIYIKVLPKHGTPMLETFAAPPVIADKITHLS